MTSAPRSRKCSAIVVAVSAALMRTSAGWSDVATTTTLRSRPSGPTSRSMNSPTSRPSAPPRPEVPLAAHAHLPTTLADQADHVDVGGRRAGDHAQQRRLAHAGAGEDPQALAAPARDHPVERADAEPDALADARAIERIGRRAV